jgi:hypothetical protein
MIDKDEYKFRNVYTSKHFDKNYGRTIMTYLINDELYYIASWLEGEVGTDILMRRCKDEWVLLGVSGAWLSVEQWRKQFKGAN